MSETKRRSEAASAIAPLHRALGWLAVVGAVSALATFMWADLGRLAQAHQSVWAWLKFGGIGVIGIFAIVAAFYLSDRARSDAWLWAPGLPFLVWIGSCLADGDARGVRVMGDPWAVGHSLDCALFILAVGVPLAMSMILLVQRRARHRMGRTATVAGLGTAAIAVFILQFFHPIETNMMDLLAHIVTVGVIVSMTAFSARLVPSI